MASTTPLIASDLLPPNLDTANLVDLMNAVIEHGVPPMHALGIRVVELRPGHVVGAAPLQGNGNHLGTMYAGTLFGLAEMLGVALFVASFDPDRFLPTVKDVQISFRRPATSDVTAEAHLDEGTIARLHSDAEEHGKAEFVLAAAIADENGQVVATTRATYQIRAHG